MRSDKKVAKLIAKLNSYESLGDMGGGWGSEQGPSQGGPSQGGPGVGNNGYTNYGDMAGMWGKDQGPAQGVSPGAMDRAKNAISEYMANLKQIRGATTVSGLLNPATGTALAVGGLLSAAMAALGFEAMSQADFDAAVAKGVDNGFGDPTLKAIFTNLGILNEDGTVNTTGLVGANGAILPPDTTGDTLTGDSTKDRDIWSKITDDWFGDDNNIAQLYEDSANHTANAADNYNTAITNAMRNYNTGVSNHRLQLGTALNTTNAEINAGKQYLGNATQVYNNTTDTLMGNFNQSKLEQESLLDGLKRDIQNGTGMYAPTKYTLLGQEQSFLNKGARNTAKTLADLGKQDFDSAKLYTDSGLGTADTRFNNANQYVATTNQGSNDKFKNWNTYADTSLGALDKLNTNANTTFKDILGTAGLTDPSNASLATLAAYIKAAQEEETRRQNDKANAINAIKANQGQQVIDNDEPGILDWIKGVGSVGSSIGNVLSWLG